MTIQIKFKSSWNDKLPTAEEMMDANGGDDFTHYEEIAALMREHTKIYVKAALESAAEKAKLTGTWGHEKFEGKGIGARDQDDDYIDLKIDKDSIRNAFDESNIK